MRSSPRSSQVPFLQSSGMATCVVRRVLRLECTGIIKRMGGGALPRKRREPSGRPLMGPAGTAEGPFARPQPVHQDEIQAYAVSAAQDVEIVKSEILNSAEMARAWSRVCGSWQCHQMFISITSPVRQFPWDLSY